MRVVKNYFVKNILWFVIYKWNNPSTGAFNELDVRGSNIRGISGFVEAARGAVPGMAEDSNNRTVIKLNISRLASRSLMKLLGITW